MTYKAVVSVYLKEGIMDPEAKTIERSLKRLGFDIDDLNRREEFSFDIDVEDREKARDEAEEMCQRLLANPTIHRYEISIE